MGEQDPPVRLIAFYLPQFHPIPENDEWWGKGFTEWVNVVKSAPKFRGHYQPHLPADMGFYDLRLPEVRQAQADLAREYGIHGFCYYHYWFQGRRLLERPFNEVLDSGKPDFPFCLCWANDSWDRTWDGVTGEILVQQDYSEDDDRAHMQWLARVFADPRYIKVQGKPMFLVYRASWMPSPLRTAEIWREEARKLGIGEIYLCRVESLHDTGDPTEIGFDAAVEFQPHFIRLPKPLYGGRLWKPARKLKLLPKGFAENSVIEYASVVETMLRSEEPPYDRYQTVAPSWDNSARREKDAIILRNSTPELYERWLRGAIEREVERHPGDGVVFLNAWNEWAEGCHLEPCRKWGRAYLEATKRAIEGSDRVG